MVIGEIVVAAAVGGAAGKFIELLSAKGVTWLSTLLADHSEAAQLEAMKNVTNFVTRLAQRVERLESDLPTEKKEIFTEALSHPSSSLLIQKSIKAAAITDSDERHTILSELIAQRLEANAEDMIALTGQAACDIVSSLSVKQIHTLGIMSIMYEVRPLTPPIISSKENFIAVLNEYMQSKLGHLIEKLKKETTPLARIDINHLVALSCISTSIGSTDLLKLLNNIFGNNSYKVTDQDLSNFEWYNCLKDIWNKMLANCTLTSGVITESGVWIC